MGYFVMISPGRHDDHGRIVNPIAEPKIEIEVDEVFRVELPEYVFHNRGVECLEAFEQIDGFESFDWPVPAHPVWIFTFVNPERSVEMLREKIGELLEEHWKGENRDEEENAISLQSD